MNECSGEAYEPVGKREDQSDKKDRSPLSFSMDTIMGTSLEALKAQNAMMRDRERGECQ